MFFVTIGRNWTSDCEEEDITNTDQHLFTKYKEVIQHVQEALNGF